MKAYKKTFLATLAYQQHSFGHVKHYRLKNTELRLQVSLSNWRAERVIVPTARELPEASLNHCSTANGAMLCGTVEGSVRWNIGRLVIRLIVSRRRNNWGSIALYSEPFPTPWRHGDVIWLWTAVTHPNHGFRGHFMTKSHSKANSALEYDIWFLTIIDYNGFYGNSTLLLCY